MRARLVTLLVAALLGSPAASSAAAPSNDHRDNAASIGALPYDTTGDTTEATREAGERLPSCAAVGSGTVWYRLELSARSIVAIDTAGSSFDTVVAVHRAGSWSYEEGCNDDPAGGGTAARLELDLTSGPYLIQVAGYGGARGPFLLHVEAAAIGPPPANDEISGALPIDALPYHAVLDQTSATGEDPDGCGYGRSTWYRYRAPRTMALGVAIHPLRTSVAYDEIWSGDAQTQLACAGDYAGGYAETATRAVAGEEYLIRVLGYSWTFAQNTMAFDVFESRATDLAVTHLEVWQIAGETGADAPRTIEATFANLAAGEAPARGWFELEVCPATFGLCQRIDAGTIRLDDDTVTRRYTWTGAGAGRFVVSATISAFQIVDLDPENDARERSFDMVVHGGEIGVGSSFCAIPEGEARCW